jgi:hypothetical protein
MNADERRWNANETGQPDEDVGRMGDGVDPGIGRLRNSARLETALIGVHRRIQSLAVELGLK